MTITYDLGIVLQSDQSMKDHLAWTSSTCFHQVSSPESRVGKNCDLKKNKKSDFFYLNQIFFYLNRIFLLAKQVCKQARLWFLIVYLKVTND